MLKIVTTPIGDEQGNQMHADRIFNASAELREKGFVIKQVTHKVTGGICDGVMAVAFIHYKKEENSGTE